MATNQSKCQVLRITINEICVVCRHLCLPWLRSLSGKRCQSFGTLSTWKLHLFSKQIVSPISHLIYCSIYFTKAIAELKFHIKSFFTQNCFNFHNSLTMLTISTSIFHIRYLAPLSEGLIPRCASLSAMISSWIVFHFK